MSRRLRTILRRLLAVSLVWCGVLAVVVAGLFLARAVNPTALEWDPFGELLDGIQPELVAQIVPAIVVAIFVFAVGTAFVIAQVVPAARGTRAVGALQGKRLNRTMAPTLALLLGAGLVVLKTPVQQGTAMVVLVGALFYTLDSLIALTRVLIDATDPTQFKLTLLKKAEGANASLKRVPRRGTASMWIAVGCLERRKLSEEEAAKLWPLVFAMIDDPDRTKRTGPQQRSTDEIYDIVRTVRGWVRVAARTNDSRELQEALETLLQLVKDYAELVAARGRFLSTVPSIYWTHADPQERWLNPASSDLNSQDTKLDPVWRPWAPPRLVARSDPALDPQTKLQGLTERRSREDSRPSELDLQEKFFALSSTWFANEVGRAVVRATELGLEARSLVARDTLRLLNTLEHAAWIFAAAARPKRSNREDADYLPLEWSAGVMLRYLTEVGVGARQAAPDCAQWYLEPCIRLANLSIWFKSDDFKIDGNEPGTSIRRLSEGAAACCLQVVDAIASNLPDKPPLSDHIEANLRDQVAKLNFDDLKAPSRIERLVSATDFVEQERLASHTSVDFGRLSDLGWQCQRSTFPTST